MKSTKFIQTFILVIFIGFTSCQTDDNNQENEQEYFEFTDNQTGVIYFSNDVSAIIYENTFLFIEANFTIENVQKCTSLYLPIEDINSILGNYTYDGNDFYGWIGCGDSSGLNQIHVNYSEINLSEFGNTNEYIEISFSGFYVKNGMWHSMNGEVHALRDE